MSSSPLRTPSSSPDTHDLHVELNRINEEARAGRVRHGLRTPCVVHDELPSVQLASFLQDVGNDPVLTAALESGKPASTREDYAHLGDIFVKEGKYAHALDMYRESGDTNRLERFGYFMLLKLIPRYAAEAFIAAGYSTTTLPRDAFRACTRECHEHGLFEGEQESRTISGVDVEAVVRTTRRPVN